MKILKYVFGALAVLVAGFFLIGIISPEVAYDCEIVVDKPMAEAWAVSQDEEKMPDWLEGFQRIEEISGTPGTVGAVSDIYFNSGGEEMVIRETIKDVKPDESTTMFFETEFMNMDYVLSIAPMDGKTKISSTTKAVGNGLFAKSVMALIGSSLKAQEDGNLANLKKVIESNTKDYFPKEEVTLEATENAEGE
jgi:hypothetical protein